MAETADSQTAGAEVATYWLSLNPRPAEEDGECDEGAWMEPLLKQNAVWFCQLRWVVIGVLGTAGFAGLFPALLSRFGLFFSPVLPLVAAASLTGLNAMFVRLTRCPRLFGHEMSARRLLWAQIITDLLILTAVIYWIGDSVPAAPFTYLFHIVLACVFFPARESLRVMALAAFFYVSLLLLNAYDIVPPAPGIASAGSPPSNGTPSGIAGFQVAALLLIWVVIWHLVSRLGQTLRSRDRDLFMANYRLNASIEERSHHMLQTTHQLKAPFAAIQAQSQLLLGGYCGALPPEARVVSEKISSRCTVLARQIQEMLQLANLRSHGQHTPPRSEIAFAALLEDVLLRLEPTIRQRDIRIEREIHPVAVQGVDDHLAMLVENLLVNAVTYSYDHGVVNLSCVEQSPGLVTFSVRDHGIGIPREKLPRIFDDYYRTEEAVAHNRASTGLGLAIVRHVAQEDSLPILVESAPGWGTRFTVTLRATSSGPEFQSTTDPNPPIDHALPAHR